MSEADAEPVEPTDGEDMEDTETVGELAATPTTAGIGEPADLQYRLNEETPFVVIPRGGAREVGRSCFQVETHHGTYLVDVGLKQGGGGQFPDLRGIEDEQIDAVFLTHAHIDHVGALPLLESHNLLAPQARVLTTRPTEALADTLLRDSFKIHRMEAEQAGRELLYSKTDLRQVLDRFRSQGYIEDDVYSYLPQVDRSEPLSFEFGNAGHLLGSAWLALSSQGQRVVFSGDLGGRSNHLPGIDQPPQADTLFLESTYGNTHSHRSASDTRTELYTASVEAALEGTPVLIPCFGVGRSQELLYMFKNRLHQLSEEDRTQLRVVYDGMAVSATDTYNEHCHGEFASKSMRNYLVNSGDDQPFLFDAAVAGYDTSRKAVVEAADRTPIIIAPSGMLTGGFSPVYLLELAQRYADAKVMLCGYQAEGTPGRVLEDALETDDATVTLTLPANPFGEGIPDKGEGTEVTIPIDWVERYRGLSAHAARNEMLGFARHVSPTEICLVHGEPDVQKQFAAHLADNVSSVTNVWQAGILDAVPINMEALSEAEGFDRPAMRILDASDADLDLNSHDTIDLDTLAGQVNETQEHISDIERAIRTLSANLAVARHDEGFSEEQIRQIVRDEFQSMMDGETGSNT